MLTKSFCDDASEMYINKIKYTYHMLIALIIYHVKINLQIKYHIYLIVLYYSMKIPSHHVNVIGGAAV